MVRNTEPGTTRQCEICGKQVVSQSEMEDHIIESHPDAATPDLRDSYNRRHRSRESDQAA
jgi:hypothetical protein